jgi:hypothetical protein
MYRGTAEGEHEVYVYSRNNWSHRNTNKRFKAKFGSHMRKTFDRFTTTDGCTWNITHNTENTAVCNLKPERWGLPLVQLNTREKRPVTGDKNNDNVIIIIIITIDGMIRVERYSPFVLQPAVPPQCCLDRWKDTSEVMCWENQVSHCNCVYHKFHVYYPGLELVPSQRETWAFYLISNLSELVNNIETRCEKRG